MQASKKTRAEQYAEIPIEEIIRMSTSAEDLRELRKIVNVMRQGFKRREAQFKRRGLYSYAADKYGSDTPTVSSILKNKTAAQQRNALVHEFAKYQAFYEAESSTIEGIGRINREQDIRIFGVDDEGNPLGTMTNEERIAYWSLYSEYLRANEAAVRRYGSDRIQQMLADFASGNNFDPDKMAYTRLLDYLNNNISKG